MTRQFFEASGPRLSFGKNEKRVFGYDLGDCVYQISGLYHFSVSQGSMKNKHTATQKD